MEPLPPPVQLGEIEEDELKLYDGTDPKKPLLMAIKGQIYDVSQSRSNFNFNFNFFLMFCSWYFKFCVAEISWGFCDLNWVNSIFLGFD